MQVRTGDTLRISMRADKQFSYNVWQESGVEIKYTEDKKRIIYSSNISLNIKPSKDSIGKIVIEKMAEGNNHLDAKNRAEAIEYKYSFENNNLILDGFFTTDTENKYRDQQMQITVFVPEGTVIYSDETVNSYYNYSSNFAELSDWDNEAHYFRILKNKNECLDCVEKVENSEEMDSLEMMDSEEIVDTLNINENKSWEEEVKDDFKNENTSSKKQRKTVTVTID
jgi:hypothetical protein